jgi:hypothetical protein
VAFGLFDPTEGTEQLVIVAETPVRPGEELDALLSAVRRQVVQTSGISPFDIQLVEPRWLVKSTSGKLCRARNRERYVERRRKAVSNAPGIASPGNSAWADPLGSLLKSEFPLLASVDLAGVGLITEGWMDSLGVARFIVALEHAMGRPFRDLDIADLRLF